MEVFDGACCSLKRHQDLLKKTAKLKDGSYGLYYDFDYGYGPDFDEAFSLAISECLEPVDVEGVFDEN